MKKIGLFLLCAGLLGLLGACAAPQAPVSSTPTGSTTSETDRVTTDSAVPSTASTDEVSDTPTLPEATIKYLGRASVRVQTREGKVIYIDPFAGEDAWYDLPADLILVTHDHFDHNAVDRVKNRSDGCRIITQAEALTKDGYQTFETDFVTVRAVEAGYNRNHSKNACVGYLLTLSDGKKIYLSGDTSTAPQMAELKDEQIDYAFFCCDGVYNMDAQEAAACAVTVGAKHNIPYHVTASEANYHFDRAAAERFSAPGLLILNPGEAIPVS